MKKIIFLLISIIIVCFGWLSFGIFSQREFGSIHLFYKHKLSPRFYFYAPIGESDTPISSFDSDQQQAERDYYEFVELKDGYHRSIHLLF